MQTSQRFEINSPQVLGELIEDEAVIVNLESGAYYSLRGTGGVIWGLMAQGMSVEEMMPYLTGRYSGDPDTIRLATIRLIEEMQQEGVVRVSSSVGESHGGSLDSFSGAARSSFESPTLMKYTDMADLLLLDPIHEVEDLGWPHSKHPIKSA